MRGHDYWSGILQQRLSRRRGLAIAGGAAIGTGLLTACGDGKKDNGEASGLLTRPVDTTKQAKRGRVLKDRAFADTPSLSVTGSGGLFLRPSVGKVYNTMLRFKFDPDVALDELEGSIVDSWEWAPDGLQIVMKLRQGVKFHNKPPVNGRNVDMDDVILMWERFTRNATQRTEVYNALNPNAPVLSFTASDSKTLVLKLKEPISYILNYFALINPFSLNLVPKEVDANWDDRADMIGTGPFSLERYEPSLGFTFKRNPDYWDKDEALVEQIEQPIISEYGTALAQFKTGAIYYMGNKNGPQIRQEEILTLKAEEPRILIYQDDMSRFVEAWPLAFGWIPEGKSPFVDERVRQAVSMSWDRDLYLDTFHNVSGFTAQGLPVETRWNSHVSPTGRLESYWLDPRGKDFGPNAKYFELNISEAKKLLAAAGYPNGIRDVPASQVAGPQLPMARHAEVINAFVNEIGITSKVNLVDYTNEYIPRYRAGKGQFEGYVFASQAGGGAGDLASTLANGYWSKGGAAAFRGFSTNGRNDQSGDPQLDAMIEKARIERDTEKLQALGFDIQRHLAKAMYDIQPPGLAAGFTMAWPCLGNFRAFRNASTDYDHYRLWVDETQPPFKST
jgi:ABC-type transport system substrate-binding protein